MTHDKRHKARGLTLIELIVTIAIIALMVALAVPNLKNFTTSNRLTSQINSFVSAVQLARSEAVKRGKHVVLCASSDQATCNTTQWELGWIVFVDDSKNPFTFASPSASTPTVSDIIRVGGKLGGNDTLRDELSLNGVNPAGALVYLPSGAAITSAANNSGNTFRVCDPGNPSLSATANATARAQRARAVNIKISGLISRAIDTNSPADGIVNDYQNPPANISCP